MVRLQKAVREKPRHPRFALQPADIRMVELNYSNLRQFPSRSEIGDLFIHVQFQFPDNSFRTREIKLRTVLEVLRARLTKRGPHCFPFPVPVTGFVAVSAW
jgi:hypothetical protein